ncbi:MAG: glutamate--tRNA ligase, partial [Candidatus Kryptonium sp.]
TLKDGVERLKPFFAEEISYSEDASLVLENEVSMAVIESFLQKIQDTELSGERVKTIAKEIQKELGVKAKDVWHALRAVLTGELEGVGVDILCDVLPKEIVLGRLVKALRFMA